MKMKAISSRRLVHSLLGGMGLLILSAGLASASDGRDSGRQNRDHAQPRRDLRNQRFERRRYAGSSCNGQSECAHRE